MDTMERGLDACIKIGGCPESQIYAPYYFHEKKSRLLIIFKALKKNIIREQSFRKIFRPHAAYRTRKHAFEEDLNHYLGENWRSLPKSLALENYLEHLQNVEHENPQLLLAYVYHLYLGLLSGAQILAKKKKLMTTEKKLGCVSNQYIDKVTDFSGVNIGEIKTDFKSAMNNIAEGMSDEEKEAFIKESNQVFLMNNLIVNSVSGQNRVLYSILWKTIVVVVVPITIAVVFKLFIK